MYSAAALTAPQGGGNARRRYLVRAMNCPLSITSKVCALALVVRPLCGLTKTPHRGVFPPLFVRVSPRCAAPHPARPLRGGNATPRSARRSVYCVLRLRARVKINALRAPLRSAPCSVHSRSFVSRRGGRRAPLLAPRRCSRSSRPRSGRPTRCPPSLLFAAPLLVGGLSAPPPCGGLRLGLGVTRPPTNKRARRVRSAGLPPPRPAYQGGVRQRPRGVI